MVKPGILDVARLINAEAVSYGCYLDVIAMIPNENALKDMRNTLIFWRTFLKELVPHMHPDAREPLDGLCDEIDDALERGGSRSKSRGSTKKLKQDGGMPKFGFGKKAPEPPKGRELALRGKEEGRLKKLGRAVTARLDMVKFEEATRKRVAQLERMSLRLVAAGKHAQAAMIQATIDGMREDYTLFPTIPMPAVIALTGYLISQSPRLFHSAFLSALSIFFTMPIAAGAAGTSAAAQGITNYAKSFVGSTSNVTAYDAAISAANVTGQTIVGVTSTIVSASTPEEARFLGYLLGACIFVPFVLMSLMKYNKFISETRQQARERRIRGLATLEDELRKLGNAKGASGIPLLTNGGMNAATRRGVNAKMEEIYTHFGFTANNRTQKKEDQLKILKKKYRERLLKNHPDKGGKQEDFEKTEALYKVAKNIALAQNNNDNNDD